MQRSLQYVMQLFIRKDDFFFIKFGIFLNLVKSLISESTTFLILIKCEFLHLLKFIWPSGGWMNSTKLTVKQIDKIESSSTLASTAAMFSSEVTLLALFCGVLSYRENVSKNFIVSPKRLFVRLVELEVCLIE